MMQKYTYKLSDTFHCTECAFLVLALVYISNPENALYPTELLMCVPFIQSLKLSDAVLIRLMVNM